MSGDVLLFRTKVRQDLLPWRDLAWLSLLFNLLLSCWFPVPRGFPHVVAGCGVPVLRSWWPAGAGFAGFRCTGQAG